MLNNAALFWKILTAFSYFFPYSHFPLASGLLFIYKTFMFFCLHMPLCWGKEVSFIFYSLLPFAPQEV